MRLHKNILVQLKRELVMQLSMRLIDAGNEERRFLFLTKKCTCENENRMNRNYFSTILVVLILPI